MTFKYYIVKMRFMRQLADKSKEAIQGSFCTSRAREPGSVIRSMTSLGSTGSGLTPIPPGEIRGAASQFS
jgi:hypothetical protein